MADINDIPSLTSVDFTAYTNNELGGLLSSFRSGTFCDDKWCRLSIVDGYGTVSSADLRDVVSNATYDKLSDNLASYWYLVCNVNGIPWTDDICAGPRGESSSYGIYDFYERIGADVNLILYESEGFRQPAISYSLFSFNNLLEEKGIGGFQSSVINTSTEESDDSLTNIIQSKLDLSDVAAALVCACMILITFLIVDYLSDLLIRLFYSPQNESEYPDDYCSDEDWQEYLEEKDFRDNR